jgi:hypothetical protein
MVWLKSCGPAQQLAEKALTNTSEPPMGEFPLVTSEPAADNLFDRDASDLLQQPQHLEIDLTSDSIINLAEDGEAEALHRPRTDIKDLLREVLPDAAGAPQLLKYHNSLQQAYLAGCQGYSAIPEEVLAREADAARSMAVLYKSRRGPNETLSVDVGGRKREICAFHYRGGDSPTTAQSATKFCYAEELYFGDAMYKYFRWDPLSACSNVMVTKGHESSGAGTRRERMYLKCCSTPTLNCCTVSIERCRKYIHK